MIFAACTLLVVAAVFTPKDSIELKRAVDAWGRNRTRATAAYGDISQWDSTKVRDMSSLLLNVGETITTTIVDEGNLGMALYQQKLVNPISGATSLVLRVRSVSDGSLAHNAGIRKADVIYSINSVINVSRDEVTTLMSQPRPLTLQIISTAHNPKTFDIRMPDRSSLRRRRLRKP